MNVALYHTSAEYAHQYSLSIQDIVSGYLAEQSGTIVIADGNQITSSNEKAFVNKKVNEIPVLGAIRAKEQNNKAVFVQGGSQWFYGGYGKGRDNYIYVYVPLTHLLGPIVKIGLYAIVVYILVLGCHELECEDGRAKIEITCEDNELNMEISQFMLENAGMNEHLAKPLESVQMLKTVAVYCKK